MFLNDLRYALRSVKNAPGFFGVAVATLALGIGATTALFSVVNGVLLAPLPYPRAEKIVALTTRWATGRQSIRMTGGDIVDVRKTARSLDALAYYWGGEVGVQLPGKADFAPVIWTSADLFRVFWVVPAQGRWFRDEEVGAAAVVSETFAARNFGDRATGVGQALSVENRHYTIVGIAPASFRFPKRAEIWVPAGTTPPNLNRTAFNYQAVARVRDDTSLEAAEAELATISGRLAGEYKDTNAGKSFTAPPLREQMVGATRPMLRLLFGAAVLVLLVACANTANLLLARAVSRSREIAVRLSLGATRASLVRQLLAEGLVLAVLGGSAGVALAAVATPALLRLAPADLPRAETIQVDWAVVGFAALVSLGTTLLFAIAPAAHGFAVDPQPALKQGGRSVGGSGLDRLRSAFVIGEIGLAFVLVVGASLLGRSLIALGNVALGYQPQQRLVMYAHAPAQSRDEYLAVARFFDSLLDELRRQPGVRSAAAVMGLPGGQYGSNGSYAVVGKHVFGPGQKLPEADFTLTSPGYFATLGIPLVRGRDFSAGDRFENEFVAIVSESLARESFGAEDPIGRRIQCGLDSPQAMTIVGIVGDVRQRSPAAPPAAALYMPLGQHPSYANEVQVVVRTALRPEAMIDGARRLVRERNPEVAVKFTTVERLLSDSVAAPRFRTALLGAFGGLALVLALGGVYGVMAYVAAQRTSEFGVRIALGARRSDVARLMLARAARLGLGGLLAGFLVAVALSRLAASVLFEIRPLDPASYWGAALALLTMTLLAAAVPAWRASRVDPVIAIRSE